MLESSASVFQYRSEKTNPKQFVVKVEKLSYYVNKTFKSASELDSIFSDLITPTVAKPTKPEEIDHAVEVTILNEDAKIHQEVECAQG